LIVACFQSYQTILIPPQNYTQNTGLYDYELKSKSINGSDILGIVVFAVVLGITISQLKEEEANILTSFFKLLVDAIISITEIVIQLTPIAVLFLVLPHVLSVVNISQLIASLGWFTLTVLIGLIIHGFIVLPSIYKLMTRKNPLKFMINMSSAAMTAFGTASSVATVPVCLYLRSIITLISMKVAKFQIYKT
jgi:Na+/H+-dicarboxylate symporter